MLSWLCPENFPDRLLSALAAEYQVIGPQQGADGVARLRPVSRWAELEPGALPLIPLKKYLLPAADPLWELRGETYQAAKPPPALALVGLPPCDLYGLDYLDRVFAGDTLYRRRRERLLLVGSLCTSDEHCFCPPRSSPPPFDLLLGKKRLWSASARGKALVVKLGLQREMEPAELPAELTAGRQEPPPGDLEDVFRGAEDWPGWAATARRCLSCGACSAVCPTCYCYDMADSAWPDGRIVRERRWDNCFFHDHALVAGGHNFRPGRGDRLRFRFEHKMLGFGELRGTSSCVGCGRCRRACPVDIDIAEVLVSLTAKGAS